MRKNWFKFGSVFASISVIGGFLLFLGGTFGIGGIFGSIADEASVVFLPTFFLFIWGIFDATPTQIVMVYILSFATSAFCYFVLGSIIGYVYDKSFVPQDKRRKLVIAGVATATLLTLIAGYFHVFYLYPKFETYTAKDCGSLFYKIKINFDSNRCYYNAAENEENLSVCDILPDISGMYSGYDYYSKYSCYLNVAGIKKDSGVCNLIPNEEGKSECLKRVAIRKRECEILTNLKSKEECYQVISR